MNKLRKNLILVLIVSLILSVNYAAFAESSESKDFSRNMDEVTEEKTTDTIATNDATEQEENKDESKEEVITVDETTEKDQEDQSETIDVSEIELEEETELEIEQEEIENSAKDKETKKTTQKSDIKEKDEKAANDKDDLQENINKETQDTEKVESKNTQKLDGHEEVATWSEFKAAYKIEDVKTITLLNDIKMKTSETSLDPRRTSLTILGKGKTLDTDIGTISTLFSLGYSSSAPEAQTFKIDDLIIKHSNSGQIFSSHNISGANWNLDLSNIRNKETKPALSFGDKIKEIKLSGEKFNWESDTYFIKNTNAEVFIENVKGEGNKIISNETTLEAKKLKIDNSKLEIQNQSEGESTQILHLHFNDNNYSSGIEINNSTVDMKSSMHDNSKSSSALIIGGANNNLGQPVYFIANNSIVNISSKTNVASGFTAAILHFRGVGKVDVSNESEVNLTSDDAGEVVQVDSGGEFRIEVSGQNTELNLWQKYIDKDRRPVMKYSKNTVSKKIVRSSDGAKIRMISAEQGIAETVSLLGSNNTFSAEKGGSIKIKNPSLDKKPDANVIKNQAVKINELKNDHSNTFSSTGEGSQFIIESQQGKAIHDTYSSGNYVRYLNISIDDGASFIARGNVANIKNNPMMKYKDGIISATGINVTVENAGFYDFANTVEGGGLILNSTRSVVPNYKSSGTGLSLWELGKNIDGIPDKSWNTINFTFGGENFSILEKQDENDSSNKNQHEQLSAYLKGKSGLASFTRISNMSITDILKIDANDLFISEKDFEAINNKSDLISKMGAEILVQGKPSSAHAISTDIDDLDFENPEIEHAYNITFSIKDYDEIKVTRKLVILDYDHVTQTKEYVVVANDFSLWEYQAESLSDTEIIERANAIGWQKDTWPDHKVPLSVSTHNVVPIAKKDPYFAKIIIKNLF